MTAGPVGVWAAWDVEQLLAAPVARKAILVASGPRPFEVPERIETMAADSIAMAEAPLHKLRLLAVRPAAGAALLPLPKRNG